jgi:hypothetical protein
VGVVGPRNRAVFRSGLGHGAKWATSVNLGRISISISGIQAGVKTPRAVNIYGLTGKNT